MDHPRLSICIPTYNFGEFIGETLDSIVCQATDETEIVIVDGASTFAPLTPNLCSASMGRHAVTAG